MGWHILQPSLSKGMPNEEALSLVEDQNVILLLEDLHEYAGAQTALSEFRAAVLRHASSCVIAATCRVGPELKLVEQELGRLYEDVPHKLKLTVPTEYDKVQFARSLGEEWGPEAAENYPTLGSIAMEKPMESRSDLVLGLLSECFAHPMRHSGPLPAPLFEKETCRR